MKFLKLSGLAVLSAALLTLSCQKRGQFEVPCKIEQITDIGDGTLSTFYNNAWGDPDSIIHQYPSTGKPDYYFTYDNQRRLKTYSGKFDNPVNPGKLYDFFVKYKYDNNNFIVSDTMFWGEQIFPIGAYAGFLLRTYTYDSKGRISNIHTTVGNTTTSYDNSYAYDANDNLTGGGPYSNKTHFLRTSLVLAFTQSNYSKNSPVATSYNSKGLPTAFGGYGADFNNMHISNIQYTCDNHNYNH